MTTFKEAAAFVILFGKHKNESLDDIGSTDAGLLYLDWLRGSMEKGVRPGDKGSVTYEMICSYLNDPTIAKAVQGLARKNA